MRKKLLLRLLKYTKPYRAYLFLGLISAAIQIALTLTVPVIIGRAVDKIIGKNNVDFSQIFTICSYLVVILLLSAFFQWTMSLFLNVTTSRTVRDLRAEVFYKINSVPLKYIDRNPHGDIISRVVNDVDSVSDGLLQGFSQIFAGVITIVGTLGIMVWINWYIALIVVVLTPLSIVVASYIAKHSHDMFQKQYRVQGELSGYIEEMIGNQKIVKTFGYEEKAQKKFEDINSTLYKYGVKAQIYSAFANPSTRFVNGIVFTSVGIFGALGAISGSLTVGQISSFLTYANQYTKPFNEITGVLAQLQSAFAAAERLFVVLDEETEPVDIIDAVTITDCYGSVKMEDVSFSYNKNIKLIENLNVTANPGDKIAIVGPTGSGKTTIVNLLMRFYDVDKGQIKVDNININDIRRNNLRKCFGMVLQETWLFTGTIRENITFGRENTTEEEVIAAAKSAHAHGFIMRMPKGYDTMVLEDGSNLSQGQKQLLCIARVMLVDSPILILDEATSNIDTRTEVYIQKAFDKMMTGRTSFVVAHRLSTIREADTILVMDKGKIVEQGNHNELLDKKGFYANLYNSQFTNEDAEETQK